MSKNKEKKPRGRTLSPDFPKTLIEKAKREVPGFTEHLAKFEQQMIIGRISSALPYW